MTTGQVADVLGVGRRTVVRLIAQGELAAVRYGRRGAFRVEPTEVEELRRRSQCEAERCAA